MADLGSVGSDPRSGVLLYARLARRGPGPHNHIGAAGPDCGAPGDASPEAFGGGNVDSAGVMARGGPCLAGDRNLGNAAWDGLGRIRGRSLSLRVRGSGPAREVDDAGRRRTMALLAPECCTCRYPVRDCRCLDSVSPGDAVLRSLLLLHR